MNPALRPVQPPRLDRRILALLAAEAAIVGWAVWAILEAA